MPSHLVNMRHASRAQVFFQGVPAGLSLREAEALDRRRPSDSNAPGRGREGPDQQGAPGR